ncbi:hypothetical protein [Psychrobacillus lasiicapitis]|nr:hypothetical protein [Psychrobacillus lasiicapitis]
MKLENTLNVDQRKSHQLMITHVRNSEELKEYKEVYICLFEGTPEKVARCLTSIRGWGKYL